MRLIGIRRPALAFLIAVIIWSSGALTFAHPTGAITEIMLFRASGNEDISRDGGAPYAPTYTLTLRSNGCAFFQGGSYYLGPGDYTGSLSDSDFNKLSQEVTSVGFFGLSESYPRDQSHVLDADTVTISVKRNGTSTRVSSPIYDGAPKAFTSLLKRIDDIGIELFWVDDDTSHVVGEGEGSKQDAYAKGVLARCHL